MSTDPTTDLLRNARALLANPESWTQGQLLDTESGHARRCLLGALIHVAPGSPFSSTARSRLLAAIGRPSPESDGSNYQLTTWNDAPGRTHAEVLDLLDRAIALTPPEEGDRE